MNIFELGNKVMGLFRRKPKPWIEIREEGALCQAQLMGGGSFRVIAPSPRDCVRVMNALLVDDPFELAARRAEELARDMALRDALTAAFVADEIRKLRTPLLIEVVAEVDELLQRGKDLQ